MMSHNGLLLVRHRDAPDAPFVIFDKQTLRPAESVEPFTMVEGDENLLKWTPLDTQFPENP